MTTIRQYDNKILCMWLVWLKLIKLIIPLVTQKTTFINMLCSHVLMYIGINIVIVTSQTGWYDSYINQSVNEPIRDILLKLIHTTLVYL